MSKNVSAFLERLSRVFIDGPLAEVAENFVYPMPFYSNGGLAVFGSADTLLEGLTLYRSAVRKAGILKITPRIIAHGVPSRGYSNVWVEWDHLDVLGLCKRTSQVRYVLFQDGMSLFPKIEMVDYTISAFPEVQDHFPMMATA